MIRAENHLKVIMKDLDRERCRFACACRFEVKVTSRDREILVSRKTPGFCADAILEDSTFLNS